MISSSWKIIDQFPVVNQLYEYFITSNLITNNQSGFRSGDSTSNQSIGLVNESHKSLDNRHEVRVVFLDISKAFDKVWHKMIIIQTYTNWCNRQRD